MNIKNFDQFFHDSPIPMWVYDIKDYSIREVNQAMADVCGYSREKMLSFTLFDIRPEEEVPKLKKYLSDIDNECVGDEGVWKLQKKNGEYVYAQVVRNPVKFQDDDRPFQLAIYNIITGELNARLSNKMLFKYSLDGIMLTNPNGEILQANPAACKILGMTEQEIIERGREGIVAKDEKLENALQIRSDTGRFAGELSYIHKSGHKVPVELTTSVFENFAGEKRTSLIFRDIHDRKKQEQALQDEQEFTQAVLSSLPGIFFVLDHEGHLVRFNKNSGKVFGLPPDEIKGRSAAAFVHESDQDKVPVEIRRVLDGEYRTFELTLKTAGGNTAIYRFHAERLDQYDQTYVIGTGIDVTKEKESLREKKTLLAEIHHRVKNNLAIVTGMMQLQAMETEDDNLQGPLRSAQQRIQTIATIHELLYGSESLSHINFEENIEELLNNIEDIYDPEQQVTVDLHIEQVPMNINQAIPCALMVNEVVTNAYKHAFPHQEEAEITVHLHETEERVVVEITDNGVGIPDHFEPETASTIGMTLINLLKQQLEGDVHFSSDNGTQFRLEFEKANVNGIGSTL